MIEWTYVNEPILPIHTLSAHLDGALIASASAIEIPSIPIGGPTTLSVSLLNVEPEYRGDDAMAEQIYEGLLQHILDLEFATVEDVLAWTYDEETSVLSFGRVKVVLTPEVRVALDRYFRISKEVIDWVEATNP